MRNDDPEKSPLLPPQPSKTPKRTLDEITRCFPTCSENKRWGGGGLLEGRRKRDLTNFWMAYLGGGRGLARPTPPALPLRWHQGSGGEGIRAEAVAASGRGEERRAWVGSVPVLVWCGG